MPFFNLWLGHSIDANTDRYQRLLPKDTDVPEMYGVGSSIGAGQGYLRLVLISTCVPALSANRH